MQTFKSTHLDNQHTFFWEVSGNYVYLGYAEVGTILTDSKWSIQRVDKSTGQICYANSKADFVHKWDDRATYTYS